MNNSIYDLSRRALSILENAGSCGVRWDVCSYECDCCGRRSKRSSDINHTDSCAIQQLREVLQADNNTKEEQSFLEILADLNYTKPCDFGQYTLNAFGEYKCENCYAPGANEPEDIQHEEDCPIKKLENIWR